MRRGASAFPQAPPTVGEPCRATLPEPGCVFQRKPTAHRRQAVGLIGLAPYSALRQVTTHMRYPSPIEADIGSPTVDAAVLQISERSSPATFGLGDSLRSG